MEALSMTKRYRSFENNNADFQQSNRHNQILNHPPASMQKLQRESNKATRFTGHTNNENRFNRTNPTTTRLLNRPSTSSHPVNQQPTLNRTTVITTTTTTTNTRSNPNVLYNKLLSNHKNNNESASSNKPGLPSVNIVNNTNIINANSSLLEPSSKNSLGTFNNNYSNHSSPINSDIFVDRLSDQRIFNRQFKIPQYSEQTNNKSRAVNSAKVQQLINSKNKPGNLPKTPLTLNKPTNQPTKSAKMTREEIASYLANQRSTPNANRKSNLSNMSNNTKVSNEYNYMSNSIYFDYNFKQRKTNSNTSNSNYFNVSNSNLNASQNRQPVSFSPTPDNNAQKTKYTNLNNFQKVENMLSTSLQKDLTDSYNENYFSCSSARRMDQKPPSEEQEYTSSHLPIKPPAIVDLLLNNQNKLYETTKNLMQSSLPKSPVDNSKNKFPINRVPVKFNKEILKIIKKDPSYGSSGKKIMYTNVEHQNRINEEDEDLDEDEEEYSQVIDQGINNNVKVEENDGEEKVLQEKYADLDTDEAILMAAINKKCDDWLDKHVLPFLDSFSNTSSPILNETDSNYN